MASMPIILLKDGTESKQGKSQIINNINACCAIADCVRTTLGPRGMDKLVVDRKGKNNRKSVQISVVAACGAL
jgi:T-complex protein 1 subunit eta